MTPASAQEGPSASVSRIVAASPAKIYGILRDYETHHPRILPTRYFLGMRVEKGGQGEGTLIEVTMRVWGKTQTIRMEVFEPVPGRVLEERDVETGASTRFTVEPGDEPETSRVILSTRWPPRPGLAGWLQGRLTSRVARGIYEEELALLDAYATRMT